MDSFTNKQQINNFRQNKQNGKKTKNAVISFQWKTSISQDHLQQQPSFNNDCTHSVTGSQKDPACISGGIEKYRQEKHSRRAQVKLKCQIEHERSFSKDQEEWKEVGSAAKSVQNCSVEPEMSPEAGLTSQPHGEFQQWAQTRGLDFFQFSVMLQLLIALANFLKASIKNLLWEYRNLCVTNRQKDSNDSLERCNDTNFAFSNDIHFPVKGSEHIFNTRNAKKTKNINYF